MNRKTQITSSHTPHTTVATHTEQYGDDRYSDDDRYHEHDHDHELLPLHHFAKNSDELDSVESVSSSAEQHPLIAPGS